VWNVVRKECKLMVRGKGNFFFLIVMPMLFMVLFGSVFASSLAPANIPNGRMLVLQQIVPGYTVMFVFFIILTLLRSFLAEKESGMLARLGATPLKPLAYLAGMWIPAALAVLVQCFVLLSFGHFVYGVQLGDVAAVCLIVICLAMCATGLGLAISLWVRGENQGRGITMLITLGGAALGGLWVPVDLMPAGVRLASHFTPQFWAQQALQDVMAHGAHIPDVLSAAAVLLGFGAAGMLAALWRYPRFLRDAVH
jgi:ABC-2 type transport system permease protein